MATPAKDLTTEQEDAILRVPEGALCIWRGPSGDEQMLATLTRWGITKGDPDQGLISDEQISAALAGAAFAYEIEGSARQLRPVISVFDVEGTFQPIDVRVDSVDPLRDHFPIEKECRKHYEPLVGLQPHIGEAIRAYYSEELPK